VVHFTKTDFAHDGRESFLIGKLGDRIRKVFISAAGPLTRPPIQGRTFEK
jgi:hypothetical protein